MTSCPLCAQNKTTHGDPRPLFNLTLPLLKIAAEGARDEVRHELSHRTSAGARNLLQAVGGPVRTPQFANGPGENITLDDEQALRQRWFKNQLYMQRIHDQPGAADFISHSRKCDDMIQQEWLRRRSEPNETSYWRQTTVRNIGSGTGPDIGMLSALGYRVTNTAKLTDEQRQVASVKVV